MIKYATILCLIACKPNYQSKIDAEQYKQLDQLQSWVEQLDRQILLNSEVCSLRHGICQSDKDIAEIESDVEKVCNKLLKDLKKDDNGFADLPDEFLYDDELKAKYGKDWKKHKSE